MRRVLAAFAACIGMVLVWSAGAGSAAAQTTPGVIPASAEPHGRTYGEWSAEWWRWAYQLPVRGPQGQVHPLTVANAPIDCSYGQSDDVWFLAGTYQSSAVSGVTQYTAVRSCTIPTGVMLMFPVINNAYDNFACPPAKPTDLSVEEMRAILKGVQDSAHGMFATIDGRSLANIAGPTTPYRVTSPVFQYTLPQDNLFSTQFVCGEAFPPGSVPPPGAVADGVFVMLAPLAPGVHVLHWGGQGSGFSQDITYTITVVPGGRF